jgi:hypothetical protein
VRRSEISVPVALGKWGRGIAGFALGLLVTFSSLAQNYDADGNYQLLFAVIIDTKKVTLTTPPPTTTSSSTSTGSLTAGKQPVVILVPPGGPPPAAAPPSQLTCISYNPCK